MLGPTKWSSIIRYSPVARDGPDGTVVHTKWNVESHDGFATLDVIINVLRDLSLTRCTTQEQLNLLQEAGLSIIVEVLFTHLSRGGNGVEVPGLVHLVAQGNVGSPEKCF